MTVLGIGLDIVHLPRFAALIQRRTAARVAARVLSTREHTDFARLSLGERDPAVARFLAVRWAVKEAAYKALFPLVRPTWGELSYTSADNAKGLKPALLFEPSLSSDTQVGRMHVSVTHDGEYVLAQVLVEERAGVSS